MPATHPTPPTSHLFGAVPLCSLSITPLWLPLCLHRKSGADYMVASKVEEYQRSIRRKVGQRLEYCGGNVVVLFDELQKAAPGTLDGTSQGGKELM